MGLPSCARAGARRGGGAGGQSGKRFAETDMGQTLVTDKCVLVSMASKDILHAPYGFLTYGLVIDGSGEYQRGTLWQLTLWDASHWARLSQRVRDATTDFNFGPLKLVENPTWKDRLALLKPFCGLKDDA